MPVIIKGSLFCFLFLARETTTDFDVTDPHHVPLPRFSATILADLVKRNIVMP